MEEEQRKDNPIRDNSVMIAYSYKKTLRIFRKSLLINNTTALINKSIVWKNEVCGSKVKTSLKEMNEIPVLSKKTLTVISNATDVQEELREVSDRRPKLFTVEK